MKPLSDHKLVAELARSSGHRAIYGIGCSDQFGISIIEQQRKALTLAWALKQDHLLSRNSKVAVVGAGFAGITFALAIASRLGCKVEVFEKEDRAVSVISNSRWRWVSPIQDFLDTTFGGTLKETSLPYLNWQSDFGWKVARKIQRKWKIYSEAFKIKNHFGVKVSISENCLLKKRPCLLIGSKMRSFDAIVLATGFGRERSRRRLFQTSYWESGDPLQYTRRGRKIETVFISGVGDGGLIEVFHHCIRDFYHDEIFSYYPDVVGTNLKSYLDQLNSFKKRLEDLDAARLLPIVHQIKLWSYLPRNEDKPLVRQLGFAKSKHKKTLILGELYEREKSHIVKDFSKWARNLNFGPEYVKNIRESLSRDFQVILNGQESTPFLLERTANFLNIALLSVLLQLNAVKYVRGKLNTTASCRTKSGFTVAVDRGNKRKKYHANRLIIRHGPRSDFEENFPQIKFKKNLPSSNTDEESWSWKELIRDGDFLVDYFRTKKVKEFLVTNFSDEMDIVASARTWARLENKRKAKSHR